jgi:hypothetical protein
MEVIRKIVTIKDNKLTVILPDAYNDREVELIILPTERESSKVEESRTDYFSKYYGSLKMNLPDEEIDKKLKALREEWNRDIL